MKFIFRGGNIRSHIKLQFCNFRYVYICVCCMRLSFCNIKPNKCVLSAEKTTSVVKLHVHMVKLKEYMHISITVWLQYAKRPN